MAWWNDIVAWFNSAAGSRIFLSAILPFVAIVLAGIIAAAIGRGFAQRVLAHEDRELTGAALIALIVVGRKASIWASLGSDEKQHIDSLMSEADIRVRLLPVGGASAAADWAAHELADMKKNSASFSFQAEQDFVDYRDRLLDWQAKPRRARKLFASDLEQWRYEDSSPANTAPQEWTPASATPGAAAGATAALPVTPGLATAPPPTTTAVPAPAPTSARAHANASESPANEVTA
jgi:hypothetical protein